MNIYSARREKMMKSFGKNAVVVLFSGKEIQKSEDEAYPFDVNRNFYYLTGLEQSEMALMMIKKENVVREFVFALPYDEASAKWIGGRMSFEEIKEISEVSSVLHYEDVLNTFARFYNRFRKEGSLDVYLDLWRYHAEQSDCDGIRFSKKIQDLYPSVRINDLFPILTKMRLIKDDYEIACIKQAITITKEAYETMLSNIQPGMNEMMMEAYFDFALKSMMCCKTAFKTIAASGMNATTLHYSDNNQVMKDGDLFLTDCGATFKNYCADISRTFPVNGKFTDRQKEIYEIVLKAQKIVQQNAKVGVRMTDLNQMVIDFYRVELPLHGLNEDVSEYYWHSVSHHLGLDTHDVDGGLGMTLQAGNVITDEPGLYIASEGIGIRIEDDLLITGTDAINLSSALIKEPSDIEAFMANH